MENKEPEIIADTQQLNENESGFVVEIKNLSKSFGDNHVLTNMSINVKKGENLVVLGKSGSGKSVLIKCLVRLMDADNGSISVLGNDITALKNNDLNNIRKKIGFLFQSAALYDSMTVGENLAFPLRELKDKTKEEIETLVKEGLESVGLPDSSALMPSELSSGMRKRIGLARTMILKPELMLYDEPTTGLDPITSKEISKLILEVQQMQKTTSIIITHDIECARITANRMIIIKDGVCAAEGTYKELSTSEDVWIRSFFE